MEKIDELVAARISETIQGDTQSEVANKIHCNQGQVSKLVNGTSRPTVQTLIELSKSYGVSVDWLLGLSDEKIANNFDPDHITYEQAILVLSLLLERRSIVALNQSMGYVPLSARTFNVNDPLLCYLVDRLDGARLAGQDILSNWKRQVASKFNVELLFEDLWNDGLAAHSPSKNTDDEDWLNAYKKCEDDRDMMYDPAVDNKYWK